MDYFRRIQYEHMAIGPGGIKCPCCTVKWGRFDNKRSEKSRKRLNRWTRRVGKRELKQEIKNGDTGLESRREF